MRRTDPAFCVGHPRSWPPKQWWPLGKQKTTYHATFILGFVVVALALVFVLVVGDVADSSALPPAVFLHLANVVILCTKSFAFCLGLEVVCVTSVSRIESCLCSSWSSICEWISFSLSLQDQNSQRRRWTRWLPEQLEAGRSSYDGWWSRWYRMNPEWCLYPISSVRSKPDDAPYCALVGEPPPNTHEFGPS
jgi:hypothetical protein